MDAASALNLASVVLALAALITSLLLTLRQLRLSSGQNDLPVVLDAFAHSRGPAYLEAQEYLLHALAREASGR